MRGAFRLNAATFSVSRANRGLPLPLGVCRGDGRGGAGGGGRGTPHAGEHGGGGVRQNVLTRLNRADLKSETRAFGFDSVEKKDFAFKVGSHSPFHNAVRISYIFKKIGSIIT